MFRSLSLSPSLGRRSSLADSSSLRVEVCPPSLRCAPIGNGWQRLLFWLLAPAPHEAAPPPSQLAAVRRDFLATLADIGGDDACALRRRLQATQSLRELWHARAEIYRVVGVAHSQACADERVNLLNRHFPTRAPRSQFGNL